MHARRHNFSPKPIFLATLIAFAGVSFAEGLLPPLLLRKAVMEEFIKHSAAMERKDSGN